MDKYEEVEVEDEGIINIPRANIQAIKFFNNKILESAIIRKNSLKFDKINIVQSLSLNFNQPNKFKFTKRNDKINLIEKNEDLNSATTKISNGSTTEKIKKVTFSTVEIIRVENFKKYNKLNIIKKSIDDNTSSDNNCIIF